MKLKAQLEQELKSAMRARQARRLRVLRLSLTAVKLAEVEKRAPLDDGEIQAILQKEIKSRRELIADARAAGREEMITEAEAEIEILQEYLPQPLSEQELERMVRAAIEEVGASSPGEIGKVMRVLMPRVRGQADGGTVNRLVQRFLSDR